MDAYTVHLAVAALVGASVVAVSAYYMHRKTLNQLLEFAKTIDKGRDPDDVAMEDGGSYSPRHSRKSAGKRRNRSRSKGSIGYYHRSSASFTDVTVANSGEVVEKRNGPVHVDSIPAGLPRLHTLPEGKSRSAHSLRPTSPKSPVASASAFESIEGSDEEDNITDSSKLDTAYLHTNGNAGPDADGEQIAMPAASMIRSHSVSGDLHGVQPDPIAADILRKEPEQETFVRLKISPGETPSADEAEVYRNLQVCLEMRQSYVFKEAVAPWVKEVISDPCTPKPNPNPFEFTSEGKSDHYFQMEDGVVHVYANKDCKLGKSSST